MDYRKLKIEGIPKSILFRFLPLCVAILGVFLAFNVVRADSVIYSQSNVIAQGYDELIGLDQGIVFSPSSNYNLSSVQVDVENYYPAPNADNLYVEIYNYNDLTHLTGSFVASSTSQYISLAAFAINSPYTFTFPSGSLVSGDYYILFVTGASGYLGWSLDIYHTGGSTQYGNYSGSTYGSNVLSNINILGTASAPSSPSVSFNYPTSTSAVDPSFSDWSLNFSGLSTTSVYYADVYLGNNNAGLDFNSNITTQTGSLINIAIPKIENLNFGTNYQATAELYAPTSTINAPDCPVGGSVYSNGWYCLSATSTINFSTASSSIYIEPVATTSFSTTTPPAQTTTTPPAAPIFSASSASTTCSSYGFIGNGLCDAGLFVGNVLFVPATTTLADWSSLGAEITNKPPVGYFTYVLSVLGSLSNGSSTPLINASTRLAFTAIFLPLNTGLSAIIWVSFGFYILRRLKHIEL